MYPIEWNFNVSEAEVKLSRSFVFSFEENFDSHAARKWMQRNWTSAVWLSAVYLILIFYGRRIMKTRPRFELRKALVIWNLTLSVFSALGAIRTIPEFIFVLKNHGFYASVCGPKESIGDAVGTLWLFLFVLSKLPELGDTMFIILRKQPLIFLHWYHHATVLILAWFTFSEHSSTERWMGVMNYSIHAFMYFFYALRALKVKPPRFIAVTLTTLQILQMIVGCAINIFVFKYLLQFGQQGCNVSSTHNIASFTIYFSYFYLFLQFFCKAYLSKVTQKSKDQ